MHGVIDKIRILLRKRKYLIICDTLSMFEIQMSEKNGENDKIIVRGGLKELNLYVSVPELDASQCV